MQSEIVIHPDAGELCLSGSLDSDTGRLLVAAMTDALRTYHRPVWQLNLAETKLIDGRSLTPLLDCLKLVLAEGARLSLTNLSPANRMLLRISRCDGLFELSDPVAA